MVNMAQQYLTTTQAAKICNVTRFTIANWTKKRKLKSSKTAGGHRRILKDDLMRFIEKNRAGEISKPEKIEKKGISYYIPRCWEFHFQAPSRHRCVSCLVFKERANKCFLLVKEFGSERIQCQNECFDCEYLKKCYPAKEKIMKKVKNDTIRSIQDMMHKRYKKEDDVSVFFKKSFYRSGKYLASIKKVISQKQK